MKTDINRYNIAFLILHYYTKEDTDKAIASIIDNCKSNHYDNYEIIVVDNGSKNGSGLELKNEYIKNSKIKVILNEENLGFSKGNNVGFRYIKQNFEADFIIMMNNDVIMIQPDFIPMLIQEYETSHFAVLGPKIVLPEGNSDYSRYSLQPIYVYRIEILKLYIKWFLNFIDKKEVIRNFRKNHQLEEPSVQKPLDERCENVIVHGSFMVFSKIYIEKFDGLCENTFLYGEEDLLFIRLQRNQMLSVYNPQMYVFHNEDSSTNAVTNNNKRAKILFTAKHRIIARKEIIKEIKKMRKDAK